jgi:hypothetical protein
MDPTHAISSFNKQELLRPPLTHQFEENGEYEMEIARKNPMKGCALLS